MALGRNKVFLPLALRDLYLYQPKNFSAHCSEESELGDKCNSISKDENRLLQKLDTNNRFNSNEGH